MDSTTPTAIQLLNVWEQARSQTPVQRALSLLALAVPAQSAAELARYSIGRRDHELLDLRERIFGSHMSGAATCPACGQTVGVDFAVNDIRAEAANEADQTHDLRWADYELWFRLPSSDDLVALEPHVERLEGKTALVQRCVTEVKWEGKPADAGSLPVTVIDALSERMAELDPQGEVQLALICAGCSHRWEAPLDIVSYLWSEVQTWAVRMLREVHALASAYGWRESDILALSPRRRQMYLEMIQP